MPLTSSEVKEIEVIVRKEIRSFMNNNTIKQFEDKLMDRIQKEIKKLTVRLFSEFYSFMWSNRGFWEPKLKNA
jgi:hypothetical protein